MPHPKESSIADGGYISLYSLACWPGFQANDGDNTLHCVGYLPFLWYSISALFLLPELIGEIPLLTSNPKIFWMLSIPAESCGNFATSRFWLPGLHRDAVKETRQLDL